MNFEFTNSSCISSGIIKEVVLIYMIFSSEREREREGRNENITGRWRRGKNEKFTARKRFVNKKGKLLYVVFAPEKE